MDPWRVGLLAGSLLISAVPLVLLPVSPAAASTLPNCSPKAISGYSTTTGAEHVTCITPKGHIVQFVYSGSTWTHIDLTLKTGAPPAYFSYGALASYHTLDGTQHVIFISSTDHHVHELYNVNKTWFDNDLTADTSAVPATDVSRLTGYITPADDIEHVDFVGTDSHIHELYFQSQWFTVDLTQAAGVSTVAFGDLAADVTPDGAEHVIYDDQGQFHLHQLSYSSGTWSDQDLADSITGSSPRPLDGSFNAFAVWSGVPSQTYVQHVAFTSASNLHVYNYEYDERTSTWVLIDWTSLAGAPSASRGRLAGYMYQPAITTCNGDGLQALVGTDSHVHAILDNCGSYSSPDLTTTTGAPSAKANSALDGYETPDSILHLDFVGSDGHGHELYDQGGTWFTVDLG
jgi:hypothetical protein